MTGRIAVVVPAYRCEKVIAETLDSVYAQRTRPNIVLVVMDEPNPELEAICRSHEINPEVIINYRNLGVGATRNIGFQHVKDRADFICFLDADDILHPDFFSIAYSKLESSPEVDAVFGSYQLWFDNTPKPELPSPTCESASFIHRALYTYFSNTGAYILSFAMLRISSIEAVAVDGKVNIEQLRNNQDFEFISRLFYKGTIIRITDACGLYRKYPNSLSSNQVVAWLFRTDATRLLYSWLEEHQAGTDVLKHVKLLEQSAIRRVARLLWKNGERKRATRILLKSIANLEWKSVAQLIVLATGAQTWVQRIKSRT